ncbi:hypothetical protein Bca52824_073298 [Brassica carinata]|uniref:Uncharacterized protein n=1 Tax=Brassica carinata TaxID=52824 RepID=A0A8X7U5Q0_BRACI|nr:hypothetical protein Bca52824_073298 [Brassica carinata]
MNPELLVFPSSRADSEVAPMAPLRRHYSCFFDDGPRSEIREGDLTNMRRRYTIHPSVGMKSPTERNIIFLWLLFFSTYSSNLEDFNGHPTGFYHLRSRDGSPLVEEPSRGVRGNYPYGDGWNSRYVFLKCVPPGFLCWRGTSEAFNGSSSKIPIGDLSGNVSRSPVSVVYDEYQKTKTRKRRPSYTPPPRLARATLSANGLSSTSSKSAEVVPNRDLLVDAHRRLIGEVFLLCSQMKDMVARRDLLIQQVKASARWELMKEWLEKRVEHWNP